MDSGSGILPDDILEHLRLLDASTFDGFRPYTPAESSVQTLARAISGSRLAACLPMAAAASSDHPRDRLPSG